MLTSMTVNIDSFVLSRLCVDDPIMPVYHAHFACIASDAYYFMQQLHGP